MSDTAEHSGRIHVATAFDRNYLLPFRALLASLLRNHAPGQIEVHIIAEGLSDSETTDISALVSESGNRISFYAIDSSLTSRFVLPGKWTSVAYSRLFLPDLVAPNVKRILYLDCDTVVVNSLSPLYSIDLEHYPLGAVYDSYVRRQPLLGIEEEGEYFNSGVMVIDTEMWKTQRIADRAAQYLLEHPERILFVDQCGLNAVLRNNWKKLDTRFNTMYSVLKEDAARKEIEDVLARAVVVHFTLQRPWQMLCRNRLRFLYFDYLKESGVTGLPWHGYTDFELRKIPAWLKVRALEFYFDSPLLQRLWRAFR